MISEKHDRFWTGLVLIIVGAVLLIDKMGFPMPAWLFKWPMILVVVGIVTGLKHRFKDLSWLIITGVGVFFLMDDMMDDLNMRAYFWPVIIIAVGLIFILRPRKRWSAEKDPFRFKSSFVREMPASGFTRETNSSEDYINSTSIFGGVKKVVTSKNFKGGEIICIMGGAEVNLSQADLTGPITIEVIQAFGGTKLVVPPHWDIRSEAIAIFAGVEDKRPPLPGTFDPNKVMTIKGTTIFGGIEIKSY